MSISSSTTPPVQAPEISGVLVIDKPAGMTSHDVVAAVRRILHTHQIGHFGTLDPFATGILPLSIGKATRFAQFYLKSRKAYAGVIRFGFSTDTYDATGKPSSAISQLQPDRESLERLFQELTGRIPQVPPPFSAKRVNGERAYALARRKRPVELKPVEVEIYALELLALDGQEARFAVECSGGTYVRSLAHDAGCRLGLPAHLSSLRRTAVAEFSEAQATTLDDLRGLAARGDAPSALIALEALLPECPVLVLRGNEERSVRHGHSFELAHSLRADRGLRPDQATQASGISILKVLGADRKLIAIARHVTGNVYHPDLVLA